MTEQLEPQTFRVTRADLVRYAGASGDFNPIHWSERFATGVGLPGVIAHGMFTMALVGRAVTTWAGAADAVIEIDLEHADSSTAGRGQPHQHRPIPPEMPRPFVAAGMEQRDDPSRPGVDAGDVRPFVAVAGEAADAEVAGRRRAPMILRDDVVDLDGHNLFAQDGDNSVQGPHPAERS